MDLMQSLLFSEDVLGAVRAIGQAGFSNPEGVLRELFRIPEDVLVFRSCGRLDANRLALAGTPEEAEQVTLGQMAGLQSRLARCMAESVEYAKARDALIDGLANAVGSNHTARIADAIGMSRDLLIENGSRTQIARCVVDYAVAHDRVYDLVEAAKQEARGYAEQIDAGTRAWLAFVRQQ